MCWTGHTGLTSHCNLLATSLKAIVRKNIHIALLFAEITSDLLYENMHAVEEPWDNQKKGAPIYNHLQF